MGFQSAINGAMGSVAQVISIKSYLESVSPEYRARQDIKKAEQTRNEQMNTLSNIVAQQKGEDVKLKPGEMITEKLNKESKNVTAAREETVRKLGEKYQQDYEDVLRKYQDPEQMRKDVGDAYNKAFDSLVNEKRKRRLKREHV